MTTCLSDDPDPRTFTALQYHVNSDLNLVQLRTASGDYLGVLRGDRNDGRNGSAADRVVVYSTAHLSEEEADLSIFQVFVYEGEPEKFGLPSQLEYVYFLGDCPYDQAFSCAEYVTVLSDGQVVMRNELSRDALFVSNFQQVCN